MSTSTFNRYWPLTIVNDMLQQLPAVSQPQRQFLEPLCAPSRAWRGRVTLRKLSRSCDYSARPRARQCRRFFAWPAVPQRVRKAARAPRSAISAAPEASFLPQSGKPTFGLGPFCHGGAKRAERGRELSPRAVVEVTRRGACTRAGAPTPPGEDTATNAQEEEETRIAFSTPPLRTQRQRWPQSGT